MGKGERAAPEREKGIWILLLLLLLVPAPVWTLDGFHPHREKSSLLAPFFSSPTLRGYSRTGEPLSQSIHRRIYDPPLSLSLSLFLSSDAFVSHFSAGCYDFPYVRGKLSTSFVRMPREGREGGETRTNTETISFINRELAEASKTTGFSLVISALVPLPDRLIIRFARAKIVPVCTRNKFTCSVSPGVSRVCTLFVTFPFFFFSRTFRME